MADDPPILDAQLHAKEMRLVSKDGTARTIDLDRWADETLAHYLSGENRDG